MVYLISLLAGIIASFIGSLVGLGGGMILIPLLLALHEHHPGFAWATPHTIVGISLFLIVFTALSSTISYLKQQRVDKKSGLQFLLGSIPGGIFGSWLNQFVPAEKFTLYFGLLMIVMSLLLFIKRQEQARPMITTGSKRVFTLNGVEYQYAVNKWFAISISFIVGVLSGLFGIGGGAIMVPTMILLFGFPTQIATATSMFMIFFVSLFSATTHVFLGHIDWQYVFIFIPAAWIGGKLGAYTNQKLTGNAVQWILRIILILVGFQLIIEGLS